MYRMRYSKTGRMRFIGHLDLVRLFQKCFRLAEIKVTHSEGFNPHMKIYFGLPLPLGMAGLNECVDFESESELCEEIYIKRLNEVFPEGLNIISLKPAEGKRVSALVEGAEYKISGENFTQDSILSLMQKEEIIVDDKNIRPLIHELIKTDTGISMKLSSGSKANLKPNLVVSLLCDAPPSLNAYTRTELFIKNEKGLVRL